MTCVAITALSLLAVTVTSSISVYAAEADDSVKTSDTSVKNKFYLDMKMDYPTVNYAL